MHIEKFHPVDWPVLTKFWTHRGLPAVPVEFLPPTGLVVRAEGGTLLCGGFLVKSDTKAASLAFICGNPKVECDLRSEALDLLIYSLVEIAKQSGFTSICAATNVPPLQKRYERLKFKKTDENVICYGGVL